MQDYIKFYKDILRIRNLELRIIKLYHQQQMRCPVHLSVGQEAVAVGVCKALKKEDKIFSAHRSHAHYLAKGGSMQAMISELYGKDTGCAKGIGGSMHLIDIDAGLIAAVPIVGSTIPIAVGYSWSNLLANKKQVTVVFFGEGATETGVFHESLNFASLHKLPIIFVCENNLYSVYTHINERQNKNRNLKKNVESFDINFIHGNGNDVIGVYNKTNLALQKLKSEKKPVFLNFDTYRFFEHCGPNNDDNLEYRDPKDIIKWNKLCPLKTIEKKIIQKNLFKANQKKNIIKLIDKEIEIVFKNSQKSKFLKINLLDQYIYSK